MTECKQSHTKQFFPNSSANNSRRSGSIRPKIKLLRDVMGRYIVAKFGTDWSIFADAKG